MSVFHGIPDITFSTFNNLSTFQNYKNFKNINDIEFAVILIIEKITNIYLQVI